MQRHAQLCDNHLVVLRNALNRAIEFRIIHSHARVARILQHHAIGNHAVEQLPLQILARRRGGPRACQLTHRMGDTLIQLAAGDDLFINYRNNAVHGDNPARLGWARLTGRRWRRRLRLTQNRLRLHRPCLTLRLGQL